MKYIRTKDGRIIDCVKLIKKAKKHILKNEDDYKLANTIITETTDTSFGWQRRVLKIADTIEELCDEFVISYDICASDDIEEDKHKAREMLECSDIMVDYLRRNYTGSSHRIYGAIWIEGEHGEDILKSVAIMNEKGELELL